MGLMGLTGLMGLMGLMGFSEFRVGGWGTGMTFLCLCCHLFLCQLDMILSLASLGL